MSEQKFYLGGNQIIHVRDDDWHEIGTWHQVATEVLELREENAELRERIAYLERAGLDASVADGETLDAWKERAWQAEKHIAAVLKRLAEAAKIIQVREDMCEGANEAIAMYKKRIADLEGQKNVDSMAQYRGILPYDPDGPSSEERVRRSRDGEASEPEPTPGFFNAENMDHLHGMMHTNRLHIGKLYERIEKLEAMVNMPSDHGGLDVTHRRIDKLADRVAQLERKQREGQGELERIV